MDELLHSVLGLNDYYDYNESDFIQEQKEKLKDFITETDYDDIEKDEDEIKKKRKKNKSKILNKHYLDDKFVTKILLRDMKNNKLSNELAEIFMTIQEHILKKPNFSGYYGQVRDDMISNGTYLFLKNWYKFKPYRVRNNYSKKDKIIVIKDSKHISKYLYIDKKVDKYDMIEIMNRTYTVDKSQKYKDGYKLLLFNKLKCDINKDTKGILYKPKFKIIENEIINENIGGGFSFLSMFAFTAARNEITSSKNKTEKRKQHLEIVNSDIIGNLSYTDDIF